MSGANPPGRRTRVLLVEDQHVVRSAIRLLLETVFEFEVREAFSAAQAVAEARSGEVDLVLLDVHMPDADGISALRRIRETDADLPVLMLSSYHSAEYVQGSLDAGANGYILKGATRQQFGEAIETALGRRGIYIDPTVAPYLLRRGALPESRGSVLSAREREVLASLAQGATNEEIARALSISEKTVKSHLKAIFQKLGVSNRTQAATKAISEGLVSGGGPAPPPGRPA